MISIIQRQTSKQTQPDQFRRRPRINQKCSTAEYMPFVDGTKISFFITSRVSRFYKILKKRAYGGAALCLALKRKTRIARTWGSEPTCNPTNREESASQQIYAFLSHPSRTKFMDKEFDSGSPRCRNTFTSATCAPLQPPKMVYPLPCAAAFCVEKTNNTGCMSRVRELEKG